MWLLTGITMKTKFKFEVVRMKFLFFPTMAKRTTILKWASILVRSNKIFCVPIFAHFLRVVEN